MNQEKASMPPGGFMHKIIWGALLWSQFIYAFVCYTTQGDFLFNIEEAEQGVVFVILSGVALVASVLLPKVLISKIKAVSIEESYQKHLLPLIIKLALLESIVIFGLVLSFNSEKNFVAPFLVVSVIGFLFSFPREGVVRKSVSLSA
ncbi:MAG: hypothetical protein ACRBBP_10075 [Bdellovibrionales bacterium]